MLCKAHHAPIHYQRVCEEGGEEVQWNDTVSGLELGKDEYFILTRDELDKLKPGGTENFEIIECVDSNVLTGIYYDKSYFVVVAKKSEKPYFLFKELLEELGLIAIGKFVMRNKSTSALSSRMNRVCSTIRSTITSTFGILVKSYKQSNRKLELGRSRMSAFLRVDLCSYHF